MGKQSWLNIDVAKNNPLVPFLSILKQFASRIPQIFIISPNDTSFNQWPVHHMISRKMNFTIILLLWTSQQPILNTETATLFHFFFQIKKRQINKFDARPGCMSRPKCKQIPYARHYNPILIRNLIRPEFWKNVFGLQKVGTKYTNRGL